MLSLSSSKKVSVPVIVDVDVFWVAALVLVMEENSQMRNVGLARGTIIGELTLTESDLGHLHQIMSRVGRTRWRDKHRRRTLGRNKGYEQKNSCRCPEQAVQGPLLPLMLGATPFRFGSLSTEPLRFSLLPLLPLVLGATPFRFGSLSTEPLRFSLLPFLPLALGATPFGFSSFSSLPLVLSPPPFRFGLLLSCVTRLFFRRRGSGWSSPIVLNPFCWIGQNLISGVNSLELLFCSRFETGIAKLIRVVGGSQEPKACLDFVQRRIRRDPQNLIIVFHANLLTPLYGYLSYEPTTRIEEVCFVEILLGTGFL